MKLSKEALFSKIRSVSDFPKLGVTFKDFGPLLNEGHLGDLTHYLAESVSEVDFDTVGCIEARGFVYGTALAQHLDKRIALLRKPGKLAPPTLKHSYELEYGSDTLEIQPGNGKILLVDDVLATGGTLKAAAKLSESAGYFVAGFAVIMDLKFLNDFSWNDLKARSVYQIA